ncbi:MAG: GNAT family N-acetyltransferase, partial [Stenotrophomonas sp.]
YTGQGYAREAVQGVLDYARSTLGLGELRAIVSQGNARSVALLEKLGFDDGGMVVLPGEDEQLLLFVNTPKD